MYVVVSLLVYVMACALLDLDGSEDDPPQKEALRIPQDIHADRQDRDSLPKASPSLAE